METFFLLIFLGIVCFVFFVYKCFTSDWHKSEQFFYRHSRYEANFDYLERMIENEILEEEFERDLRNSRRENEVEDQLPKKEKYNYEDLLFGEDLAFEYLMEESGL